MTKTLEPGLYIVATPIGNLSDLSSRAADILRQADVIAVEDSRVTGKLLNHLGIKRPMTPYHDHVAEGVRPTLVARMASEAVALVSDAGTPLISDRIQAGPRRQSGRPCRHLRFPDVRRDCRIDPCRPPDRSLPVRRLPSVQGKGARRGYCRILSDRATLILYGSGPRLGATLAALASGLGDRETAPVAREISKMFEECVTGTLSSLPTLCRCTAQDEIVIIVSPPIQEAAVTDEAMIDAALRDALSRLPPAKAVGEVSKAMKLDRQELYARAMALLGK